MINAPHKNESGGFEYLRQEWPVSSTICDSSGVGFDFWVCSIFYQYAIPLESDGKFIIHHSDFIIVCDSSGVGGEFHVIGFSTNPNLTLSVRKVLITLRTFELKPPVVDSRLPV